MNTTVRALAPHLRERLFALWVITAVMILAIVTLRLTGCATTTEKQTEEAAVKAASLEEKWGIRIIWVKQSAAGYMIDFRYRVTDKEKAAPLFKRQTKPYLLDQETGTKLFVLRSQKVGTMRTSVPPHANRNYIILFANKNQLVKLGSKVTVVIGDLQVENLVVE